eukprot:jgi/Astpho2/4124/Aster-01267
MEITSQMAKFQDEMRLLERRMQETSQTAELGRQNKALQEELVEKEQQLQEVLDAQAGLERRVLEVQEQLLREHEAVAAEKLAAQQEYVAEYNGLATEFNDLVQELESANDNIRATERSRDHFQAQLAAELKRTVEFMMARQAAWAATGPMRGLHPNYEQRRAYAQAPQGMAGGQVLAACHSTCPVPGFPAPAYAVSAPGQVFPQHPGLAPNVSSHLRSAAAASSQAPVGSHAGMQAATQGPTDARHRPQVAMVPMHAQPGVPPPGAQPQQAALVPLQSHPPGPSQVDAQHQQQQAAVVPVQAQAQGPSHVEQQQRIDHAAVQGPSQGARQTQQAGAAQPSGAQGLEQGSAQPTAQPTHQDRTGQAPVQASCPQQGGIQFGSFGQGENAPLPSSSDPSSQQPGPAAPVGSFRSQPGGSSREAPATMTTPGAAAVGTTQQPPAMMTAPGAPLVATAQQSTQQGTPAGPPKPPTALQSTPAMPAQQVPMNDEGSAGRGTAHRQQAQAARPVFSQRVSVIRQPNVQPSAGALFAPATQQTGDTPQAAPAASPATAPAGSNLTQLGSSSGSSSSTGSRGAAPTEPTAGGASATTAAPSPVPAATGANTADGLSWADRAKRAPAHPPQPKSPLRGAGSAGSQAARQGMGRETGPQQHRGPHQPNNAARRHGHNLLAPHNTQAQGLTLGRAGAATSRETVVTGVVGGAGAGPDLHK